MRTRVERALAVTGAAALLVVGFDGLTYAATGQSLLLGRLNQADAPTIVQNTGSGSALDLRVSNPAAPPFTTNSTARVPNLNAARAGTATTAGNSSQLNGLSAADLQRRALPGVGTYRAARQQWWGGRTTNQLCVGSCTPALSGPSAAAFDGMNMWVTNATGNSAAMVLASTGAILKLLKGGSYNFANPSDVAFDGANMWVTNAGNSTITVFRASDGAYVRTIDDASFGLNGPSGIAFDGRLMWVVNHTGNSLTAIRADDGTLVRKVNGAEFELNGPTDIAFDGTSVWVTNTDGNSVTQVRTSTGGLVKVIKGLTYSTIAINNLPVFSSPEGIAFDGSYIWIAERGNNTVTKLDAFNGNKLDVLWQIGYGFNKPTDLVADGNHVWVVSSANSTIVRVDADTGDLQRRVRAAAFGLSAPTAIAYDGAKVWVTNSGNNSLTYFPGA